MQSQQVDDLLTELSEEYSASTCDGSWMVGGLVGVSENGVMAKNQY